MLVSSVKIFEAWDDLKKQLPPPLINGLFVKGDLLHQTLILNKIRIQTFRLAAQRRRKAKTATIVEFHQAFISRSINFFFIIWWFALAIMNFARWELSTTGWLDWKFQRRVFFFVLIRYVFPKCIKIWRVNDLRSAYNLFWIWHFAALRTLRTCRLHPRNRLVGRRLQKFRSLLYNLATSLLLNYLCLLLQLLS